MGGHKNAKFDAEFESVEKVHKCSPKKFIGRELLNTEIKVPNSIFLSYTRIAFLEKKFGDHMNTFYKR